MKVKLLSSDSITASQLARVARLSRGSVPSEPPEVVDRAKDLRTLINCYKMRHLSLFEFKSFTFEVRAPIYVLRQIMRYRCGSYLERSLRYCQPLPELCDINREHQTAYNDALRRYTKAIDSGEKKEVARALLPLCTPSIVVIRWSVRELFHVYDERLHSTAQSETRQLVSLIYDAVGADSPWVNSVYNS